MEQLENRAGVLGRFGLAVREGEKKDDRFLVAKSGLFLSVVIDIGPGRWAPFFGVRCPELGLGDLLQSPLFCPPHPLPPPMIWGASWRPKMGPKRVESEALGAPKWDPRWFQEPPIRPSYSTLLGPIFDL